MSRYIARYLTLPANFDAYLVHGDNSLCSLDFANGHYDNLQPAILDSKLTYVWLQVRDSLGLTYDVSFELSQFDRLRTGYFVVHVTSTPAKIRDALAASVDVLRSFHVSPVSQRELVRAQKTLLTRHESDLKVSLLFMNFSRYSS